MKTLQNFSTKELHAEIRRREEEEARKLAEERHRVNRIQNEFLSLRGEELMQALNVVHERTSCDDTNLVNGWGSHPSGGPRCLRCALLGGYIEEGWFLQLSLQSHI